MFNQKHLQQPWCIFANSEVVYDGRAYSVLERGNYLIIHKGDGSLQIHGSTKIQPRNYQGAKSELKLKGKSLISTNKKEMITIIIHKILWIMDLIDWSESEIVIKKTEAELVEKMALNPAKYCGLGDYTTHKEYSTSAGPVDLVIISTLPLDYRVYVIEAKRKKITLKDCYQLKRYLDALSKSEFHEFADIIGCLAGPEISGNALAHCEDNGFKYLQVRFEEEAL